jgi:hypothetical protein
VASDPADDYGLAMRPALAATVAAFTTLAGCAHKPEAPPIELTVAGDERGCRIEAEGRIVASGSLAEAEAMLAVTARRWRGQSVTILRGMADAPYKCFGLAVYVLQRERVDGGSASSPSRRPGRTKGADFDRAALFPEIAGLILREDRKGQEREARRGPLSVYPSCPPFMKQAPVHPAVRSIFVRTAGLEKARRRKGAT